MNLLMAAGSAYKAAPVWKVLRCRCSYSSSVHHWKIIQLWTVIIMGCHNDTTKSSHRTPCYVIVWISTEAW